MCFNTQAWRSIDKRFELCNNIRYDTIRYDTLIHTQVTPQYVDQYSIWSFRYSDKCVSILKLPDTNET